MGNKRNKTNTKKLRMGTHLKRASKGNGDYGIKPSARIIYGADTFFGFSDLLNNMLLLVLGFYDLPNTMMILVFGFSDFWNIMVILVFGVSDLLNIMVT